ncbi:MAG: efflux RND transporter periplasmic adaptor subunit [Spirochaetales bacterium]|nr:efflux RND transporter periplasmic adaptor subunit [Spirochaetales bacterium]
MIKTFKRIHGNPKGTACSCFFPLLVTVIISLITGIVSGCQQEKGIIQASGTIEATEVTVSAEANGKILSVNVTEGSVVEKEDVIALIDSSTLQLQKEQAEAGVVFAEANFALLMKGARSEDIKQAEDQLIQVSESLQQAKADYERMKELYSAGSVTKKQYDDAKTRYTVIQAQYSTAEQALSKLKNLARPEDIEMAKAKINQARISVRLIEKQIKDCTVRAPCKGTVTNKLVEAGEFAITGSPVVVISNLAFMSTTIYVSETELGRIRIGQKAFITIDSFPGRQFDGIVAYISPNAEFTPKNIQTKEERIKQVFGVKIELDNPDGVLKTGIPADAVIPVENNIEEWGCLKNLCFTPTF